MSAASAAAREPAALYDGGMTRSDTLTISSLHERYRSGRDTPRAVMERLLDAGGADERHVWITRLAREQVLSYVRALDPGAIERLPLYGIPFVIKDNIDLAHVPTTAGCPGFAYTPPHSAVVVQRLLDAGAIPLGKTNLDQFATGLVGVRSPYGACRNSFDSNYISGGSSSGSAVAVATGLASFSLGTDTAGSGRVPAAFNNIIGLKPSNGRLSSRGVVPACRSVDCVSIFALCAQDAMRVLEAAEGFDAADPYSRRIANPAIAGRRFGIPRREQLQFFGDTEYARLFELAVERLRTVGATPLTVDFEPFLDAARLLYDGPWVAERYAAVGSFIDASPEAVHPVTRRIIEAGKRATAVAAFEGEYRLQALKRACEAVWAQVDFLATPTAGTIYRIDDVEADPIRLNANLGIYTNFMNLCDLSGVAVPAGFRADGLPFGITLVGPRGADRTLLEIAGPFHCNSVTTVGALRWSVPPSAPPAAAALDAAPPGYVNVAVCGSHMQGLPLNHQLLERGAYLVQVTSTAPRYRLFALPGEPPQRPGMTRVNRHGAAVEVEIWALPAQQVGSFVAGIPAPLGLGKIELASGDTVTGFLCESYATETAADITRYGGWRAYLDRSSG